MPLTSNLSSSLFTPSTLRPLTLDFHDGNLSPLRYLVPHHDLLTRRLQLLPLHGVNVDGGEGAAGGAAGELLGVDDDGA